MPPTITAITDPTDPRLDDYRTLRDPELRKRYENRTGVFIAEGPNVVREMLTSSFAVKSVLVADQRWLTRFLLRLAPHAVVVSPDQHQADFRAAAAATLSLYDRGTSTMNSTDSQT